MTTTAAAQVELRKEFRKWLDLFWKNNASLAQVVTEDFPDPDDGEARPTRYDVDSIRDLAQRIGALVEGYEHA